MAGYRIPGPQDEPDECIQDGTLALTLTPTPGPVCEMDSTDEDTTSAFPLKQQHKPQLGTCVFFFGGYKSSQDDMQLWLNSAQGQRSDVTFHAFPYPAHMSSIPPANVVDGFNSVVEQIQDTEAEKIFIVGHSSGCAIANGVARRLKDNQNIALVALDGFCPDAEQLKAPKTQVWGARNGDAKSLHFDDLEPRAKDRFHPFTAHRDCTNKVSLHFSLVNVAASDRNIKNFDDIKNGYKGCVANLCWLK